MTWHNALSLLPDADRIVLIHMPHVDAYRVWLGYWDAESRLWRYTDGEMIEHFVRHWAELPVPPEGL
jgi:hypothetical protein